MQHIRFSVIETAGIPRIVITPVAFVEVLIQRSVEARKTLLLVLDRMRVNQVHDDRQSGFVAGVDQFLEFLGSAEAR